MNVYATKVCLKLSSSNSPTPNFPSPPYSETGSPTGDQPVRPEKEGCQQDESEDSDSEKEYYEPCQLLDVSNYKCTCEEGREGLESPDTLASVICQDFKWWVIECPKS